MNNLSLVIPVRNEVETVIKLADEIELAFKFVDFEWEVIWVNDNSQDETAKMIEDYSQKHTRHCLVHLTQQLGQSAAVLYGISRSKYKLIATLDGDGQNSPYDLLALKNILNDTDVLLVQGVRINRKDPGLRLFSTGLANTVRNAVLGVELNDVGCAVRVFRKETLNGFPIFKGWHRFLPVMIALMHPGQVIEHPVNHRPRISGTSNYGIQNRLWVGIFDLFGVLWLKKRGFSLPLYEKS